MTDYSLNGYKKRLADLIEEKRLYKIQTLDKQEYKEGVKEISKKIAQIRRDIWRKEKSYHIDASTTKPIGRYYAMIFTYEQRKEKIRQEMMIKHNWNGKTTSKYAPEEYKKAVWHLSRKIDIWKTSLKRVQKKSDQFKKYVRKFEKYTGRKVDTLGTVSRKNPSTYHGIFIKYGMEHGILGVRLAARLGINKPSRQHAPSMVRKNFTKSFALHPENRELYHRFVRFMNESEA